MATLPIYDKTGAEVGTYEIDPNEIAPKISKQLMHDAVIMYQANRRQGSAKTKSRAEVVSSRKKMYRQKGTGNARAGHRTSGVRRGGGHIFAKRPRDFSYSINKKALRSARNMALASKITSEQLILIDELSFDAPKTQEMATILKALNINTTLLLTPEKNDTNVYKSARNIPGVQVLPVSDLNTYDILRPKRMLMTKAALDAFCGK